MVVRNSVFVSCQTEVIGIFSSFHLQIHTLDPTPL